MPNLRTAERSTDLTAGRHPADLVETGNLLRTHPTAFPASPVEPNRATARRHDVIVIGAGQAGLSIGYHLKRKGIDHVILDGASRIGDVWRNRWGSLRLFTPAKFDGLDGFPFPAQKDSFPTKDQMADYLESYAARFDLLVRLNARVEQLHKVDGAFCAETSAGAFEADHVVVAAASYQEPCVPEFSRELDEDMVQMHSHQYRNPAQIPDGPVLLVGAGNSGAEIAVELAKTHEVYLSGRDVGQIPSTSRVFWGANCSSASLSAACSTAS